MEGRRWNGGGEVVEKGREEEEMKAERKGRGGDEECGRCYSRGERRERWRWRWKGKVKMEGQGKEGGGRAR